MFSSRNEFNATRQKRDLLTTEVGYTSERVGNSSPCSARGLCCCDNGAFVRSKATVTEGQWAGAAVPYLLPPAEAHGLTHSFTPGKSSLNYPPRQNSWRTPWEITPPLFCFLWRWTESPRKLLVFDEKHSDNCIRGYRMWWWRQQLQLSPGPHHCSLRAVPPHAPHCRLAQVMSDWNFIVKRNLVPLWVNTLCCRAQGRVTGPFYRGRRGAQSLRSGSCRQPATQPQIIFSQSLGDLSDEDGKQPVWNITLRWVKPLLLTRKTLSEGNGLWELMVAQRSAQQDSAVTANMLYLPRPTQKQKATLLRRGNRAFLYTDGEELLWLKTAHGTAFWWSPVQIGFRWILLHECVKLFPVGGGSIYKWSIGGTSPDLFIVQLCSHWNLLAQAPEVKQDSQKEEFLTRGRLNDLFCSVVQLKADVYLSG